MLRSNHYKFFFPLRCYRNFILSNKCRINKRFYFGILISKHLRTDVILIRVRFKLHINSISVLASYYSGWAKSNKINRNPKVIDTKREEIFQGSKFNRGIRDKLFAEYWLVCPRRLFTLETTLLLKLSKTVKQKICILRLLAFHCWPSRIISQSRGY